MAGQWIAQRAAQMLSGAKLEKQRQLYAASQAPRDGEERIENAKQVAVKFKSWSEVAGFFDTSGSIVADAFDRLKVEITRGHRATIEALQEFFTENGIAPARSTRGDGSERLRLARRDDVKRLLRALLESDLLVKKQQAELALSHTKENHWEIREKIQALNGNHKKFQRQDREGATRAAQLNGLSTRLSKSANEDKEKAEATIQQIQKLKMEQKP